VKLTFIGVLKVKMSGWSAELMKPAPPPPEPEPAKPVVVPAETTLEHVFYESTQGNLDPWVTEILAGKVKMDQFDTTGYTALHLCVWQGAYSLVVKLITEAACPIDIRSKNLQTGLALAAARGNLPLVKLFLDRGADIESRDACGMTPILCAAHNGQVLSVYVLKARGANLEAKDLNGCTAIHLAASKNQVKMMRVLKGYDFSLEEPDQKGLTPLHKAAENNSLDAIDFLLFEGAAKEPLDKKKRTPAALANENNVEGPSDFIHNYSTQNLFYSNFSYIYTAFWLSIAFVYFTEMLQDTYLCLTTSLFFNISLCLVIPLFL
jgi:ankyrin repeat protein